jgi:hypothetical protein
MIPGASDLIYRTATAETYSVGFNAGHRQYFPKMSAEEALLLKCYDPRPRTRAVRAAHRVRRPDHTADALPREDGCARWCSTSVEAGLSA